MFSIRSPQKEGYLFEEGGILSPDGHCRAFDADSHGTVFGNGVQCVKGGLFRLGPPLLIDSLGNAHRALDMTVPPLSAGPGQVTPGSFWQFQFFYRDAAGGGAQFNTSDAVSILFCP